MAAVLESYEPFQIDAMLVLGRGIEGDGTLSDWSRERAEVAVGVASALLPRVVVFSGGRSWQQAASGIAPPSEGGTMLQHANVVADNALPTQIEWYAEETSESTVANMVNSHSLLGLCAGETLGILS